MLYDFYLEMEQNLDVDEIWRALRPWGLYQIRQMAFMWAANLPCSVHLLAVVFIGKVSTRLLHRHFFPTGATLTVALN